MNQFRPGPLTADQARKLNEQLRVAAQFHRLTVAPPLQLTRVAGIPVISAPSLRGSRDLLYEITGNNAATPPVHTGKRKTRNSSNNVVDYSPAETQTQILNPAEETWANGTLIELVAIPDHPGWYWGFDFGEVSPDAGPCSSPGWLMDRSNLESAGVLLRVIVRQGKAVCSCVPEQGANDLDPIYALREAGPDAWTILKNLELCCGCSTAQIEITDQLATPNTYPLIAGTIDGWVSCDDAAAYSFTLIQGCTSADGAVLHGFGADNCDFDLALTGCDQTFKVEVSCVPCVTGPECTLCRQFCGPLAILVSVTGFGGGNAVYNRDWYLTPEPGSPCLWSATCGGVTVTHTVTAPGGTGTRTLAFSGGTSSPTYTFAEASGLLHCFDTDTVTYASGDGGLAKPATLSVVPKFCQSCEEKCCGGSAPATKTVTLTVPLGGPTVGTATITLNEADRVYRGSGSFTPGGCGTVTVHWEMKCSTDPFEIRHSCDGGATWSSWNVLGGTNCAGAAGFLGYPLGGSGGNCTGCADTNTLTVT